MSIAFQAIFVGTSATRSMMDGRQSNSREDTNEFTILVDGQPGELALCNSSCLEIALLGRARVFLIKDSCLLIAINETGKVPVRRWILLVDTWDGRPRMVRTITIRC